MRSAVWVGALCGLVLAACSLDRGPSEVDLRHEVIVTEEGGSLLADGGASFGNAEDASSSHDMTGVIDASIAADGGGLPPLGFTELGTCEPTGIFAVRLQVDVAWGGRSNGLAYLTDNGRGSAFVDAKLIIDNVEPSGRFTATLQACNAELPPFFSTILCEVYQPLFPTMLWDQPGMPKLPVTGAFSCNMHGCAMHFDKILAPIGIDLDPKNRKWPSANETLTLSCAAGSGKACFPDQDGDKQPGISVGMRGGVTTPPNAQCPMGYPLRSPPLSDNPSAIYDGVQRADQLYLGVRVSFSGDAVLNADCIHALGKGIADGFDSRAPGCRVQTGTLDWPNPPAGPGTYCSESQRAFIDQSLPNYFVLKEGEVPSTLLDLQDKSASAGALLKVVRVGRVGDAVGCGVVRTAVF